jgi:hypothetical protein
LSLCHQGISIQKPVAGDLQRTLLASIKAPPVRNPNKRIIKMPTTNNNPLITITDVLDAMHSNLPSLDHSRSYTLQQLVGNERWLASHTGHRKQLGAKFKALALSEELPVSWVDRGLDNIQVYEMK